MDNAYSYHYLYPGRIGTAYELRTAAHEVAGYRDGLREIAIFLTEDHEGLVREVQEVVRNLADLEIHIHDKARYEAKTPKARLESLVTTLGHKVGLRFGGSTSMLAPEDYCN